jgi:hypothetical protein
MSTAERYAAQIEADRQAHIARPKHEAPTCFSCGREYTYRAPKGDNSGRFCSTRCREWYDAGNPPYDPLYADRFYSLPKGPEGFYINCAGCHRRFDSKGLRCCSPECERAVCSHEDGKRYGCQFCGRRIPKARRGRAKFCEDDCATANRRKQRYLADDASPPANGAMEGIFPQRNHRPARVISAAKNSRRVTEGTPSTFVPAARVAPADSPLWDIPLFLDRRASRAHVRDLEAA